MIGLLKLTKIIYSLFLYYEKHRGAAIAAGVETPESVHPSAYAGAVHFFGISNIGTFSHLKVSNGARTSAVLNGASMALRLRPSLMVPKPYTLLLQLESCCKEKRPYYLPLTLLLYICLKLSGNGYLYKACRQG